MMPTTTRRLLFFPMAVFGLSAVFLATASAVTIPTVAVGHAGNAADTTGYGTVGYGYRLGTTEVTNAQYVDFLNAVAATDTYGLYNSSMGSGTQGGITRTGLSGSDFNLVKSDAGS